MKLNELSDILIVVLRQAVAFNLLEIESRIEPYCRTERLAYLTTDLVYEELLDLEAKKLVVVEGILADIPREDIDTLIAQFRLTPRGHMARCGSKLRSRESQLRDERVSWK